MAIKTTVTPQDVARNVRAEDEEIPQIEFDLKFAESWLAEYIRRDTLDEREQDIFDLGVMFAATDFYLNGAGSSRNIGTSKYTVKYTGLNSIIDTLKKPSIGGELSGDL